MSRAWNRKILIGVGAAACSIALLFACSSAAVRRPDGGEGPLPVGAAAPDFAAITPTGETVRLSSLRGHPVVAYFYPKDGTPGCTKEACAFRNAWKRYEAAHVGIIGISADSEARHRTFMKEHALPFPLAADEDNAIARSYGVKTMLGMDARVTYLIDKDGKVARVWPNVDPGVHADEVLPAAESLR